MATTMAMVMAPQFAAMFQGGSAPASAAWPLAARTGASSGVVMKTAGACGVCIASDIVCSECDQSPAKRVPMQDMGNSVDQQYARFGWLTERLRAGIWPK